jgi:acetyltransferase-like isoleucine patch superfamily enzyme
MLVIKKQHNFFVEVWRNRRTNDLSWRDTLNTALNRLRYTPHLFYYWWKRRRYLARGHEIAPITLLPWSLPKGPGKLRVGNETSIHKAYMILHEDITIGSRVVINHGVRLMTGSHDILDRHWRTFEKPIVIKDYAWIAEHSIILPGVTIGRGAVVGAGAVVRFDVPDYAVVSGNPARAYPPGRSRELDYSPIQYIPTFQAWLGADLLPTGEPDICASGPSGSDDKEYTSTASLLCK